MQLVLSKNRVIAHGENFLAMGGVVINTETGAKYENATIAECNGCPSDINEVGYEYHAGVFVPCAPYGKGRGNGYFMEVCPDCATPRNSGIPIIDINWGKVGSVTCAVANSANNGTVEKNYSLPISDSVLAEYSMLRYRIKAGSYFTFGELIVYDTEQTYNLLTVNGKPIYKFTLPKITSGGNPRFYNTVLEVKNDIVIPFYMVNSSYYGTTAIVRAESGGTGNYTISTDGTLKQEKQWYSPDGGAVDPSTIKLTMPSGIYSNNKYYYSNANVVVELEGRK